MITRRARRIRTLRRIADMLIAGAVVFAVAIVDGHTGVPIARLETWAAIAGIVMGVVYVLKGG